MPQTPKECFIASPAAARTHLLGLRTAREADFLITAAGLANRMLVADRAGQKTATSIRKFYQRLKKLKEAEPIWSRLTIHEDKLKQDTGELPTGSAIAHHFAARNPMFEIEGPARVMTEALGRPDDEAAQLLDRMEALAYLAILVQFEVHYSENLFLPAFVTAAAKLAGIDPPTATQWVLVEAAADLVSPCAHERWRDEYRRRRSRWEKRLSGEMIALAQELAHPTEQTLSLFPGFDPYLKTSDAT
jgi:hypothetical protein